MRRMSFAPSFRDSRQRQLCASGILTPERSACTSETMVLEVPSQREISPAISTTWLPSSLLYCLYMWGHRMACASPVSSSMVTNIVPSLPFGCCLATGQPATSTGAPSSSLSTSAQVSTSGASVGRTNSIRCPRGYIPITAYSAAIFSASVKSARRGTLASIEAGSTA